MAMPVAVAVAVAVAVQAGGAKGYVNFGSAVACGDEDAACTGFDQSHRQTLVKAAARKWVWRHPAVA